MSQVSIIIPTLNEATNLGRTFRQLTLSSSWRGDSGRRWQPRSDGDNCKANF